MERNKIEDLFKDKLEGYVLEPSNEARNRFHGMIRRKKQKVLIWRIGIAASVLLFAIAGIYSFRIQNTDKIDLAGGESYDAGYGNEMAIVKEIPGSVSIPPGENDKTVSEKEIAYKMEGLKDERSSGEISQNESSEKHALITQAVQDENLESELDHVGSVGADQEYEPLTGEQIEESTYLEYFVADPDIKQDEESKSLITEDQVHQPMKITIEYIASGNKDTQSDTKRSNFYSKLDNMKTMGEALGDLRSYKDRLFALDFKKEETANNEEITEE